jgi:hypothetical protein
MSRNVLASRPEQKGYVITAAESEARRELPLSFLRHATRNPLHRAFRV